MLVFMLWWCAELGTDIEERGLVINWSTFRFAFCQGGDGESDMTMDVQDLAMFVRDPGSVVTCILLPLSASMHMHQQVSPPAWVVLSVFVSGQTTANTRKCIAKYFAPDYAPVQSRCIEVILNIAVCSNAY